MEIHTIKTEKEYEFALKTIDELLSSTDETTKNTEQLEILSILVEDYENKNYKITVIPELSASGT